MTITLELSTEQEKLLEEGAARHSAEVVRQVLLQAVDAAVPKILAHSTGQPTADDFQRTLDALATDFADSPPLSDDAVSREGIYGDYP